MLTKKTDKINIWRRGIVQGCWSGLYFDLFSQIHNKRRPKHVNERPLYVWLRSTRNSFIRICIGNDSYYIIN